MSEVVSVRVRKETKKTLERAGIDIASKTREYLEGLAQEARNRSTLAELHELVQNASPAAKGSSARLIRQDREAHDD